MSSSLPDVAITGESRSSRIVDPTNVENLLSRSHVVGETPDIKDPRGPLSKFSNDSRMQPCNTILCDFFVAPLRESRRVAWLCATPMCRPAPLTQTRLLMVCTVRRSLAFCSMQEVAPGPHIYIVFGFLRYRGKTLLMFVGDCIYCITHARVCVHDNRWNDRVITTATYIGGQGGLRRYHIGLQVSVFNQYPSIIDSIYLPSSQRLSGALVLQSNSISSSRITVCVWA